MIHCGVSMSWSQTLQRADIRDQLATLVGSAVRLLGGEAGVFVVSNEAFDPQSSAEYITYQLSEAAFSFLLEDNQSSIQPGSLHPLLIEPLTPAQVMQLELDTSEQQVFTRCALALYDQVGPVGTLYFIRPAAARSCFERYGLTNSEQGDLPLFITQLAASIRLALRAQALAKEQDRFAAIFHYSAEGILTVDNALRIIDFNPAMEHFTGWREYEVLGRFYFEVLRPKDRQGKDLGLQDSPILQAFAGQSVVNREMYIAARDGQHFLAAVTASVVRSALGEPVSGILNVRDITRERQQEEQRSTFISVISHELQTPIAIIKGYASTLARRDVHIDPQVVHSRLVAIEEEADRLNKLVGNLLYASRIQAGGIQMDVTALDLAPLIRGVIRRFKAKSPDVTFKTAIPANLPSVMADRERIEEVLQNLIDNAIKYSPQQRNITIACRATGEEVIVSVSDRGMGISLREQEQIFERFHRVGEPLAPLTPGAGLGLYICRAIIEAHGGNIWVESTLRQGSTFSFSLPREEKAHLPMVVF